MQQPPPRRASGAQPGALTFEAKLENEEQVLDALLAAAQHAPRAEQASMLRRAADLSEQAGRADEKVVDLLQHVLRLEPGDVATRARLEALYVKANRLRDVVRLSEQALAADPPPDDGARRDLLARVVELYADKLHEPERAMPHVEQLLALEPTHEEARKTAQKLLTVKGLAGRAAAALAQAAETSGTPQEIARYLAVELESTRGPRRAQLLARLGTLRSERMGDDKGALEAFEQALAIESSDDEMRGRYVALASKLGKWTDAAKTLGRLLGTAKEPAVRAKATAQLGEVLLRAGDAKRAKATLAGVAATAGAPPEALLSAARGLREIHEAEKDTKALCEVLERLATLEPDGEARREADERLAELATARRETARAVAAYERLLETGARAKALAALAPLYEASRDPLKIARLLEEQAKDATDDVHARALMMRAASARAEHASEPAAAETAIASCQAVVERFGPARDVLAILLPLLEGQRRWGELAKALEQEAALVAGEEHAQVMSRLGQVRLQRLRDVDGAIDAFDEALAFDANDKAARSTLEKLAALGDHRLQAARVLEPVYRREGATGPLVKLLELRGGLGEDVRERLAALREAADLAMRSADTPRAVELIGRALTEAVRGREPLREWIERLDAVADPRTDPKKRATILGKPLGDRDVDGDDTRALAMRAAEAFAAGGDIPAAIALYRKALAFDPEAPGLRSRLDGLLVELHARTEAADAATYGDAEGVRASCARLLEEPDLSPERLDAVDRAAARLGDTDLARAVLQRRAAATHEPREQIAWLDRLGELEDQQRGDLAAAATAWKRAAAIAEGAEMDEEARRLHGRARKVAPEDGEVLTRLVALCEGAGAWHELPALYAAVALKSADAGERVEMALRAAGVLAERLGETEQAARRAEQAFEAAPGRADVLARFEELSLAAGSGDAFDRAVQAALAKTDAGDQGLQRRLRSARARVLSSVPSRVDDAALEYRTLLSESGWAPAALAQTMTALEELVSRDPDSASRKADRRWLLEWRAAQAPPEERASRLLAWARDEEQVFGDPQRALELLRRVLAVDGECDEALASVARLALAVGSVEEALSALRARRDRAQATVPIDVEIADVLLSRTDRVAEALAILEQACDASEDHGARARILARLLEAPAGPADTSRRQAWFERLGELQRAQGNGEAALATALRAAGEMPEAAAAWDRAEDLARALSRPDDVAALYEQVLARSLPPDQAAALGERALRFHEEWFEDPTRTVRILDRVLELDPTADWAFDRIKLLLDAAERWDELFALYDRALQRATGRKRASLLEDAAQTAKDFADRPDRAIDYLEELQRMRPGDAKTASALERLYERQGRHAELVSLLEARLATSSADDARRARLRMASLWLGDLGNAARAFDCVEPLLPASDQELDATHPDVWPVLERILARSPAADAQGPRSSAAPPPASESPARARRARKSQAPPSLKPSVRQRVARWLKEHYERSGRRADLARVLLVELEATTSAKERCRRHVELAELYESIGDTTHAFEQLGLAVAIEPGEHAAALLVAARRLEPLLEAAGRTEDRLPVLEKIASLEQDRAARRDALGRAARLAWLLGEDERSVGLWRSCLEQDPKDVEALDGQIQALERIGDGSRLIDALTLRSRAEEGDARRRDRIRVARLLEEPLGRVDDAIAAWRAIESELGVSDETVRALAGLLRSTRRWKELAELLEGAAGRAESTSLRAELLRQLGDLRREELGAPRPALSAYALALAAEPGDAGARAGLLSLASDKGGVRIEAVDALLGALRACHDWRAILELTAHRLAAAGSDEERVDVLREAAELAEKRAGDAGLAFEAMRRAFAVAPQREGLLAELERLAESAGAWTGLVEALEEGITRVGPRDPALVSRLRTRIGATREERLGDASGALESYLQAIDDGPSVEARSAVVRLAGVVRADGQVDTTLRLADALVEAGQGDRAADRLERALAANPRAEPLRERLRKHYLQEQAWERLAQLVAASASQASDKAARLDRLMEAADLFATRCGRPEAAIPLLEQASDLSSGDQAVRLRLAGVLAVARRFDDARAVLQSMIAEFGGRRPRERAPVHYQLAQLELAVGNRARALLELDTATRVDPQSPDILHALAELARDDGQLDRAERSYRALLLVLRRQDEGARHARSEILLELRAIAERQGESKRAAEILETALEAAATSEPEQERLEAGLRARSDHEVLVRVLEAKLARLGDSPAAAATLAELAEILGGRLGRPEQALPLCERAVALGHRSGAALRVLAARRLTTRQTIDEGVRWMRLALELEPEPELDGVDQALRGALEIEPEHRDLIALYEQVGRRPGRERALLHALELRSALPGSGVEVLREAVEVAVRLGEPARAESLLARFVEAEQSANQNVANLAWAMGALASLREAAGDLHGAVDLKKGAARIADPEVARRLEFEVARIAAERLGDLTLAADTYEAIHRRDPADREAWEPLAAIYRRLGDTRRLADLLAELADYAEDAAERARLRLERVRTMMDGLALSDEDAVPLLRDVVEEDASQVDAALMLAAILERSGADDELVALLSRLIEAAKDRGDSASVASVAVRLGRLLEAGDRVRARNVYYGGLDWQPESRELLDALVALLGGDDVNERTDLLERRLALEHGPAAEDMALSLAETRRGLGDEPAAERALEIGYRAYPASVVLRDHLEAAFRERGEWRKLAELCVLDARARPSRDECVARLREAAAILRAELTDSRGAAEALREARDAAPEDASLLGDLVDMLVESGDCPTAVAALSSAIEPLAPGDPQRGNLLAMRAAVRERAGDDHGAIADFEAAFAEDEATHATRLAECIERALERARGDARGERALRLRRAQVLPYAGDADSARAVLVDLLNEDPRDRAALRTLGNLEMGLERWEAAAAALKRVVVLEDEGAAAVEATLRLADACERAGRPGDARGALERARITASQDRTLRERLERVYEQTGAWHEVASLALEDARARGDVALRFEQLVRAGRVLLERAGDPAKALAVLEEGHALRPGDPECAGALADAYAASGRTQDAAAALERVVASYKGKRVKELAPLHARQARVLREAGDGAGELRSLSHALDCDSQNGQVCSEVAVRAMDLGHLELAGRALRAITLLKTPGPVGKALAYRHLGEIAHQQGDPKRAILLLKRALAEDPSLESARTLIGVIERDPWVSG